MTWASLQGVDHEGDHTPDFAGASFCHMDVGIVRAFGFQVDVFTVFDKAFHGQFIIDYCDHHLAAGWLQGAVHHQDVVVVDAGTDHGVAGYPDKESGGGVSHHEFIEVEPSLNVVVRRARKSC